MTHAAPADWPLPMRTTPVPALPRTTGEAISWMVENINRARTQLREADNDAADFRSQNPSLSYTIQHNDQAVSKLRRTVAQLEQSALGVVAQFLVRGWISEPTATTLTDFIKRHEGEAPRIVLSPVINVSVEQPSGDLEVIRDKRTGQVTKISRTPAKA